MNQQLLGVGVSIMLCCEFGLAATDKLSPTDEAAAFRSAGYKLEGRQWRRCDDPGTPSYAPGSIQAVRDLNHDGRLEVMLSEGSAYCYGNTGTRFNVLSKQANGGWKLMIDATGMPRFLGTKGVGGWPDIEIGGPGFCFAVVRWNGHKYTLQRREYEGKPCR